MQLMPNTAVQYGDADLFNPEQNIDIGTRHLKYLLVFGVEVIQLSLRERLKIKTCRGLHLQESICSTCQ